MRAYVRFYLKYPPDVLSRMSVIQLAQAFNDIVYVRSKRNAYEAEE